MSYAEGKCDLIPNFSITFVVIKLHCIKCTPATCDQLL